VGEQGLVVSSQRGQALPDGGPLRARDTPPLHSGPTARQPPRARRKETTTPAGAGTPKAKDEGQDVAGMLAARTVRKRRMTKDGDSVASVEARS
jgi:hypothetical protein